MALSRISGESSGFPIRVAGSIGGREVGAHSQKRSCLPRILHPCDHSRVNDGKIRERRSKRTLVAVSLAAAAVGALDATRAMGIDSDRLRDPSIVRTESLGRSLHGRPIKVLERGDPDAPIRELVG